MKPPRVEICAIRYRAASMARELPLLLVAFQDGAKVLEAS